MPAFDQCEVPPEVSRQLFPGEAPIVVMPAAGEARQRASQIEADDVLEKPFDIDDLLHCIEHHSRRP